MTSFPFNTDDDEALVKAYRNTGDLALLGKLYQRYAGLVYGVALKYFKLSHDAEDAVTVIFEELIEKLKNHEVQRFKPWLHTVTRNYCLMQLRGKKFPHKELTDDFMFLDDDLHLENVTLQETKLNTLEDCIELLNTEQKEAVSLFYLHEKCYKEIAEITGKDTGKVRSYIQNGRRNLKICMEEKLEQ